MELAWHYRVLGDSLEAEAFERLHRCEFPMSWAGWRWNQSIPRLELMSNL